MATGALGWGPKAVQRTRPPPLPASPIPNLHPRPRMRICTSSAKGAVSVPSLSNTQPRKPAAASARQSSERMSGTLMCGTARLRSPWRGGTGPGRTEARAGAGQGSGSSDVAKRVCVRLGGGGLSSNAWGVHGMRTRQWACRVSRHTHACMAGPQWPWVSLPNCMQGKAPHACSSSWVLGTAACCVPCTVVLTTRPLSHTCMCGLRSLRGHPAQETRWAYVSDVRQATRLPTPPRGSEGRG